MKIAVLGTGRIGGTLGRAFAAAGHDVRYARAFNSLGVENLQNPQYGDVVGDMFYTSTENDREIVEQLVGDAG